MHNASSFDCLSASFWGQFYQRSTSSLLNSSIFTLIFLAYSIEHEALKFIVTSCYVYWLSCMGTVLLMKLIAPNSFHRRICALHQWVGEIDPCCCCPVRHEI